MGRGGSPSIPYFPFYVTQDDKIKLLEAEFGLKGFAVYIHLLQHIYGGKGYYACWNKDVSLMFSRDYGVGVNDVSEIVNGCLRRGIFDGDIYDSYGVLTSKEIQECYFFSVKRRTAVKIIDELLLSDPCAFLESGNIIKENVNILSLNANGKAQRKEKKSKVNISSSYSTRESEKFSLSAFGSSPDEKSDNDEDTYYAFDMLPKEEADKLREMCGRIVYRFWNRPAKDYDIRRAADALNMFYVTTKQGGLKKVGKEEKELLREAVSIAADNSAEKWSYVFGIFRKWAAAGIKNYDELIAYQVKHSKR